jgi:hypothetical protein
LFQYRKQLTSGRTDAHRRPGPQRERSVGNGAALEMP